MLLGTRQSKILYKSYRSLDSEGSVSTLSSRHASNTQNPFSDKLGLGHPLPTTLASQKIQAFRTIDNTETNENAMPLMPTNSMLQPRPIIRNKALGLNGVSDSVEYPDLLEAGLRSQSRMVLERFGQQESLCFDKTGLMSIAKTESSVWPLCTPVTSSDTLRPTRSHDIVSPRKLAIVTPLITSPQLGFALTQSGGRGSVFLKLENLQPTGSVCLRAMEYICRKVSTIR